MSHELKEKVVREYAERSGLQTFIETGTFGGAMVKAMLHQFSRIFSIELSPDFVLDNRVQFSGYPHVLIIHGDSGKVLPVILEALVDGPALFWLDGHYSAGATARGAKETPILEELAAICADPKQVQAVILIDDAGWYGAPGRPSIEDMQLLLSGRELTIEDDIIRITPCA